MKNNQPVTDHEIQMKEGQVIVTKTNLKGVITYVNRDFVEISGFSESELIGNNHNMVRHPDMPTAAFEDLWSTLKQGNPWVGIIKNRCKNGDYYWVEAHVTPIYKNGHVVEYMSVRKKPEQNKVNQAQTLYQEINSGTASLRPKGINNILDFVRNRVKLSTRLGLGISLIVTLLVMLSLYSSYQMKMLIDKTEYLQQHSFAATTSLLEINDNVLHIQRIMKSIKKSSNKDQRIEYSQEINTYETSTLNIFKKLESLITGNKKTLYQAQSLFADWKQIRDTTITQIATGKLIMVDGNAINKGAKQVLNILESTQKIIDYSISQTDEIMTTAINKKQSSLIFNYSLVVITIVIAFLIAFFIIRAMNKPLKQMVTIFRQLQDDPLSVDINLARKDEIGNLLQALKSVQIKLGYDIKESEEKEKISSRIKQALDNVNGNVIVTDINCNIIYMNAAVEEMMSNAESDLKKDLSEFDTSKLMGSNFSIFYNESEQQKKRLTDITESISDDLIIGGRHLRMISNSVNDHNGERLGTVIECIDRTQQVKVEEEIQSIVNSALAGDLSQRISLNDKENFLKRLSQGMNDLVDVNENVINDTVRVMGSMAQGNLTKTITSDYRGSYGQLKNDVNQTISQLTGVLSEISENSISVMNGANEIAQGNTDLSHRTEEQASSLEQTASSMEEMTSTVRQNADNARQANQLAADARSQAEKGGDVLSNAVSAMSEITTSSRKIADIIGVIDEIAFQTNLLALNAAVEAARAGEQGRGFAVVASEVRNLAGRSATAAKEIKALIADSEHKVNEGSKLVDESGKTLDDITHSVKKVSDIIAEIAAASEEQSIGIEQVNKAVSQMDEMTQQNAALVEQAAAASEAMGERARSLSKQVGFFTTDDNKVKHDSADRRSNQRPWSNSPPASQGQLKNESNTTPISGSNNNLQEKSIHVTPTITTKVANGTTDDSEWEEF